MLFMTSNLEKSNLIQQIALLPNYVNAKLPWSPIMPKHSESILYCL
jgi:hypothetical protein